MKKLLSILLSLALVFTLAACATEEPPAETPTPEATPEPIPTEEPALEPEPLAGPIAEPMVGVTVPAFEVFVNGVSVTHEMMAEYQVYSVVATAINSAGTETTAAYIGFQINDVLDAARLSGNFVWLEAMAGDGYAVTITGDDVTADTTLLAISEDGSPFNNGPWLAPCTNTVRGSYLKDMVSILANTEDSAPDGVEHILDDGGSASLPDGLPEILDRTDKVEFAPFSFLVNGEEVTNETLDGLSIYKITAVTENNAGEIRENGYTGYNLADVLVALGLSDAVKVTTLASDEFEAEYIIDELEMDWVLVAIERDGEPSEDGTIWFAPCADTSARAFARDVVELIVE